MPPPVRAASCCPPAPPAGQRFRLSAATLIHHEIALALTLAFLTGLSWNAANPVAAQAFGLLFAMRLSTKLNIFVGVPHFDTAMLPPHLAYLGSYFRTRPAGVAMAASLAALACTCHLARHARRFIERGCRQSVPAWSSRWSRSALLEHLFLVVPVKDASLWRWAKANNAFRTTGAAE